MQLHRFEKLYNRATNALETFKGDFDPLFSISKSTNEVVALINTLESAYLNEVIYYSEEIPVYFTVTITEKNSDGEEIQISSSILYENARVELKYGG